MIRPTYRDRGRTAVKEFDLPPDGAEELRALLEHSGAAFQREGNRFRFRFAI